ncbi:hypothetical protein ACLKA7_007262 [Drosophila subpalustris]
MSSDVACDLQLIPYGHFVMPPPSPPPTPPLSTLPVDCRTQEQANVLAEILASRAHANFMGTQKKATQKKCEIHFLSSSQRTTGRTCKDSTASLNDDDKCDKCASRSSGRGT